MVTPFKNWNSVNKSQANLNPHQWQFLHADYLFIYARTRVNDEEIAKDLVQETFLAALECAEQFKGKCSERTWLTSILKYKTIGVYRNRAYGLRSKSSLPDFEQEEEELFEVDMRAWKKPDLPKSLIVEDDYLGNKEFAQLIEKRLRKLPGLWVSAFTKKYFEGQLTPDICSDLNITPSNFWVIIHRTKLNLRTELLKHWV